MVQAKVRRDALSCLGQLYKLYMDKSAPSDDEKKQIREIRNKILHAYYHVDVDDRCYV